MYGYKTKVNEIAPAKTSEIDVLIDAELLKTKAENYVEFHIEFAKKFPLIKVTGDYVENRCKLHLNKLAQAEVLIEKGEPTEDASINAIIAELNKEVK